LRSRRFERSVTVRDEPIEMQSDALDVFRRRQRVPQRIQAVRKQVKISPSSSPVREWESQPEMKIPIPDRKHLHLMI
jgi:hypothetical protein